MNNLKQVDEKQVTSTASRFVVLDVETSGLDPKNNRIVEIALVTFQDGVPIDEWNTLLNPEGSVGPTNIHGISEFDVQDAPKFHDVEEDIKARISNVVVVAHNAKFDLAFLRNEFLRSSNFTPELINICTLSASAYYLPDIPRRRLVDCCSEIGIEIENSHSALGDAIATGKLMTYYLNPKKYPSPRKSDVEATSQGGIGTVPIPISAGHHSIPSSRKIALKVKEFNRMRPSYNSLVRLLASSSLDTVFAESQEPGAFEYLEKVIEALEDGAINEVETTEIEKIAAIYDLNKTVVEKLNFQLLNALAHEALKDELVSLAERRELTDIAKLLSIDEKEITKVVKGAKEERAQRLGGDLKPLPEGWSLGQPLLVGDRVVFTGCDPDERAKLEFQSKKVGIAITGSVSAKTKYLVTDGSYSGNKVRDAEKFGTPKINPGEYKILLQHVQPAGSTPLSKKDKERISSQTGAEGLDVSVVRNWAIQNGYEIAPKGRLQSEIFEAYRLFIAKQ
jgi:DNA polymerase-3 subunit epsilon